MGREALKPIRETLDLELAAVNDLMPVFEEIEAHCYEHGLISGLKNFHIQTIAAFFLT
jgi:hypothetical protein